MFFYCDKPYKGTRPADLQKSSDGFPDSIARARLMAWLLLFAFVGIVAWVLK